MLPAEFAEKAPGKVIRSVLGHWTFEPEPLPPELNVDVPLFSRLSEADQALGQLAGIGRTLPNPHLLIRPFIRREAVLSSRIEGTVTQLDQLFLFEAQPEEMQHPVDAAEVRNYVLALEHGLEQIRQGYPWSLKLLQELHSILMRGVRGEDKRPGQIRDRAVLLGWEGQTFETARFVPPCHTKIEPMLRDFVQLLRGTHELPLLVQLALVHYQFEAIHPFNDGNGRVGRLLIPLLLCERGSLSQPMLYLSAYFEQHRSEYYDCLLEVSRRGAWNEWISFFAHGVTEQSRDAANRAGRLLDLWQSYRRRVADLMRSSAALRLIDELFASPFITIKRASEAMGVAFKSARNTVDRLVQAGILREITGQQRYRVYCADEVFRLLDEPLE